MAIARMTKIIIASHRTEASELLESLQGAGICHILRAEDASVSKELPERGRAARRRDAEAGLDRVNRAVTFLGGYAEPAKGLNAMLAPRAVIDEKTYNGIVEDSSLDEVVDRCLQTAEGIETALNEKESLTATLAELEPWESLDMPVEQLGSLGKVDCLAGLLPGGHIEQIVEKLAEVDASLEVVGSAGSRKACIAVCLKEQTDKVQKVLRSFEFETATFAGMKGTVAELIADCQSRLKAAYERIEQLKAEAGTLAEHHFKLRVLFDHYSNLLDRERTKDASPATEQTVVVEGWVKNADYGRLEKLVSRFGASTLVKIEPAEGEEVPVEIDNNDAVRPFESITRLYGMPMPTNVDPTVFLAPFFTIFFGLCLTDAGYGIVLVALLWFLLKRVQGDKKFMWMLFICSVATIIAGAMTGGWFGDAVQQFIGQDSAVDKARKSLILFDPMTSPMTFFGLSLGLGYLQIMFGLCIALGHNIRQKDMVAAVCDQVTWLVMLNSLILFGLAKSGMIPSALSPLFAITSIVPAVTILLFSVREGGWGGRIGMGVFNLFCTVFYMGDVLSYVRIMALGMVTGGFGMAVNICAGLLGDVPYLGWLAGAAVFVLGHVINIALSVLGSFVHSMRLQFVEFFPKFFEGGGKQFVPLRKQYRHVYIDKAEV